MAFRPWLAAFAFRCGRDWDEPLGKHHVRGTAKCPLAHASFGAGRHREPLDERPFLRRIAGYARFLCSSLAVAPTTTNERDRTAASDRCEFSPRHGPSLCMSSHVPPANPRHVRRVFARLTASQAFRKWPPGALRPGCHDSTLDPRASLLGLLFVFFGLRRRFVGGFVTTFPGSQ